MCNTDHPRVCGEQGCGWLEWSAKRGSPPRVRGTDLIVLEGVEMTGITPACAGNRQSAVICLSEISDHPRVCGEQCRV